MMVSNCLRRYGLELRNAFTRKKKLKKFDLNTPLNRCLNTFDLAIIGMAAMTGAGIYVLVGIGSRLLAGPALIISHLIAAFISLLNAMVYSELGCQYPKAGALFTYGYIAIGEAVGFFLGWTILMEYIVVISAVARAFGGLIDSLSLKAVSNITLKYIGPVYVDSRETYPDFIAGSLILVLVLITLSGVRISNYVNILLTAFNYTIIIFISIVCLVYMEPGNYAPKQSGGFSPFGFDGILQGAALSFFIYVGFDAIAVNSEEAKTPRKSLPLANFCSISILFCAVILSCVSLHLFISWNEVDTVSPFTEAFKSKGLMWASYISSMGIMSCLITNSFVHLVSAPKLLFSFGCDGLLSNCFSYLLPKTKVAVFSSLSVAAFTIILAIILPIESLAEFVSIGCIICYSSTCLILVILRYSNISGESSTSLVNEKSEESVKPGELSLKYRETALIKHLISLPPQSTPIACILLYTLLVFALNILLKHGSQYLVLFRWWAILLAIILSLLALLCMVVASFYEQQEVSEKSFKVPLVPFYPCLTLFLNCLLLANISSQTWIRYAVWLLIGMMIYFCYGMFHSHLREKPSDETTLISESKESHQNYSTVQPNKDN